MKFVKFGIFAFALSIFTISCAENNNTENTAEESMEEAEEAMEDAGEAMEESAEDAAEATEDAAHATEEAVEEAHDDMAH